MNTFIFDGSLEGLLTAVFEWFERKPGGIRLTAAKYHQPAVFEQSLTVISDPKKADRVWKALQEKVDKGWIRRMYCAYLSELQKAHQHLFDLICYLFQNAGGAEMNYGNEHVLQTAQVAKKVEREKHRMEAFIRFQQTADGMFYCCIDPDFNVLPLISRHFRNRYADQKWLIYDLTRKYGLHYDLHEVSEIEMEFAVPLKSGIAAAETLSETEALYATLWKDYFKSTNIPARKNTKLHIQHVPKRYWKYLTEKQ
jgi:probable DNA metabolism protein